MAILLKQQLLSEVLHYTPPHIDVRISGRQDVGTRQKATRMFYDFYAMEFLHRTLGTQKKVDISPTWAGKYDPKRGSIMQKGMGDVAFSNPEAAASAMYVDWNDDVQFGGQNIVPEQLRNTIDNLYEEVTFAIGRKLLHHLRLTCIQELRHLISHSSGWGSFRNAVVSHYNANGTITKEDFQKLIAQYLPDMVGHEEATKRLLMFSRYYSKMSASSGKDPADVISKYYDKKHAPKVASSPDEPLPEPEPDDTDYTKPLPAPGDEEPDTTDYGAEIEPSQFDDEEPSASDFKKDPSYLSHDKYWDPETKKDKLTEDTYGSGVIHPHSIRKVFKAFHKANMTWDDVVLAYNNVPWGGGYGGPKWGSGVVAFLKLNPEAKNQNAEQMAGLIDHIYDLVHNGGNLLNKGGMFVEDKDLDRRAKVTHVARYLPSVSPVVHRLILRVLGYLSGDPEIEKNIGAITNSPTQNFTQEQKVALATAKLTAQNDVFVASVPFQKKKGVEDTKTVQRYYTVKSHTNGMFSAADSLDADVQVFKTFPELMEFVNTTISSEIKSAEEHGGVVPIKEADPKQVYINSHTRTKLPNDRGYELFTKCKMGWRKSNQYYKAYFPGDKRFLLYVFTDDTCLASFHNKSEYNVFKTIEDWASVVSWCEQMTSNADPYPDMPGALAAVGKGLTGTIGQPVPAAGGATPSVASSTPTLEYTVNASEANAFHLLIQGAGIGSKVSIYADSNGMISVSVGTDPKDINSLFNNPAKRFSFGRKTHASVFAKPYRVIHYSGAGVDHQHETWSFSTWTSTSQFIGAHLNSLISPEDMSGVGIDSPTVGVSGTLPSNATSKAAYKVHVGIEKPPKSTIRLTVEDEAAMANIGFEPKKISSDVWYIHKNVQDTVKFYPDNTAKIIFTKTSFGSPIVKKTIDEMLAWLPTKYFANMTTSPVNTPAVKSTVPSQAKGISLDTSLFKSKIKASGFIFDIESGTYKDNGNILLIKPDRSSTITLASGETKEFKNLPELLAYLSGGYLAQKKSNPIKSDKSGKLQKLKELLAAGGFKKVGAPPVSSGKGIKYANAKNDVIVIYQDYLDVGTQTPVQPSSVYVAAKNKEYKFNKIDTLIEYLATSAFMSGDSNDLGGLETGAETKPLVHDGLTVEEYNKLSDVVKHYALTSKFDVAQPEDEWSSYATISSLSGVLYTVGALGNYYQINNPIHGNPLKTYNSFPELLEGIDGILSDLTGKEKYYSKDPSLTDESNPNQLSKKEMDVMKGMAEQYNSEFMESIYQVALSAGEEINSIRLTFTPKVFVNSQWKVTVRKLKGLYEIFLVDPLQSWKMVSARDKFSAMLGDLQKTLLKFFGSSGGENGGEPDKNAPITPPTSGVGQPLMPPPPSTLDKGLTKEEIAALMQNNDKNPKYKVLENDFSDGTKYVFVEDSSKTSEMAIASFTKQDGKYEVSKLIDFKWITIKKSDDFDSACQALGEFINDYDASKNPSNVLTEDEKEWVSTFISSQYPNLKVENYNDGSVTIRDPNKVSVIGGFINTLFFVNKTKSSGYHIVYFKKKWGQEKLTVYFNDFDELKKYLLDNLLVLLSLMVAPPQEVAKQYFEDFLKKMGFVHANKHDPPGSNKVYDKLGTTDRLVVYSNGTSVMYYSSLGHKVKKFKDQDSLVSWLGEYYKDITIEQEVTNILKANNYQDSASTESATAWINQASDQVIINNNGSAMVWPGDVSEKLTGGKFPFETLWGLKGYLELKNGDKGDKQKFFEHTMDECEYDKHLAPSDLKYYKYYYKAKNGNTVTIESGEYKINIKNGNMGHIVADPVDAAYLVMYYYMGKTPEAKASVIDGNTGDSELDEMIKSLGFTYDGAKPGNVLGMWFTNALDATITIHDDKSVNYSNGKPDAKLVSFDNFEDFKSFLQQTYGAEIAKKEEFLDNPALAAQWSQLWNTLSMAGFALSGHDSTTTPKSKTYIHVNKADKVVVYNNGSGAFLSPNSNPKEFSQFHLLSSFIMARYFHKEKYAKSYYDDLGDQELAYSIRLTESDEASLKSVGWIWVSSGESFTTSGYVHKDTLKKILFYNKKSDPGAYTATLFGQEHLVLLNFIKETIPEVVQHFLKHPEKISDENPVGGKYTTSYYDDVGTIPNGYGIRLMKEHEQVLNDYGFEWREHAQVYRYTPDPSKTLIFYNLNIVESKPNASLIESGKAIHSWGNGKMGKLDSDIADNAAPIIWALDWIKENMAPVKGGFYSTSYYHHVGPSINSPTIRLKKDDEDILIQHGFKWNPAWVNGKTNSYVNVLQGRRLEFPNKNKKLFPDAKYGAYLKSYDGTNTLAKWPYVEDALIMVRILKVMMEQTLSQNGHMLKMP